MLKTLLLTGTLTLVTVARPGPAGAMEDKYWVGDSSWWDYEENWDPPGQPHNFDTVYLVQNDAVDRTVWYYNTEYPDEWVNLLTIDASGPGTMTFEMTSGFDHPLKANGVTVGGEYAGILEQYSGDVTVSGELKVGDSATSIGTYDMHGGSLRTADMHVGCDGEGALHITNASADITVSNMLSFGPRGTFTAVPGTVIHMTGATFAIEGTDGGSLAGLGKVELVFEGGVGDVDPFEVAGEDRGAMVAGFFGNFAVGGLTLGGVDIGQVVLAESFDNSPGPDAQYVKYLSVGAGSTLDLNGHTLYYGVLVDGAGAIIGGAPVRVDRCGDADMNGVVDGLDLTAVLSNWDTTDPVADLDGNSVVDGLDLTAVINNWSVAGGAVPEPATVLLAALCGMAAARRCRHR